jgi:hypothetical protein
LRGSIWDFLFFARPFLVTQRLGDRLLQRQRLARSPCGGECALAKLGASLREQPLVEGASGRRWSAAKRRPQMLGRAP